MKTVLTILLYFSVLCFSPRLYAGDIAELNFIGFSDDGDYAAFESYGEHDGSALPYSDIFIIHVAKNRYAVKPIKSNPREVATLPLDQVREQTLKQAQPYLDKFYIVPFNQGNHAISHTLHDLSIDPLSVEFLLYPPTLDYPKTKYKISLKEIETEESCFGFGKGKKMQLSLFKNEGKKVYPLQHDKKLPKTRGCPLAYRIQDIYIYDSKSMIIFLNMMLVGHEGQNVRYLAVTGMLP